MDVYRHLSLFLSIKDFLSLTSCNKNLRRLYFEKGTIWKSFLERDFFYKYHPSYDWKRYKVCFCRKNINFCKRKEDNPVIRLTYIDFNPNLKKLRKSLENWGLIYNDRPVLSQHFSIIILFCMAIFSPDYETPDMVDFTMNSFTNLIDEKENISKYKDKSYSLFCKIGEILYLFDRESIQTALEIKTSPNPQFFQRHENYPKAKMMWHELGF